MPRKKTTPSEKPTRSPRSKKPRRPTVPEILNIIPLRDSVIYPMLIAPLGVSRESSIQLIEDSIENHNQIIGVVVQKEAHLDHPKPKDIYDVGCVAVVRTLIKTPDTLRLIIQGISRFKIVEMIQEQPFFKAKIELLDAPSSELIEEFEIPLRVLQSPEKDPEEIEALRRSISALFEQAVKLSPHLPDELRSLTQSIQETHVMADLVAAHISVPVEKKQKILETLDIKERLYTLLETLSHEVRILELTSKVHNQVNVEISKNQRDYYLREQLKAIQRELGEYEDRTEDTEKLLEKINTTDLPPEPKKEITKEFDRLKKMNPSSQEYTVVRTYLETMLSVPWSFLSEEQLDLAHAQKILDQDHYGLEKIKERLIEFLSVRIVKKEGKIRQPILCLVGPPGVGKTSLGKSVAQAMGRKFVRISLGGMRDEAEIRGHRRTYVGAMPGQIVQGMRRAGTNDPVFGLDELDKLGNSFHGDPSSALLEVLDPEQNSTFKDHYLDVPLDLSNVFFIATVNRLDTIPAPLLDRMEVIEITGYTEEEKYQIAQRYLVPKEIEEHGLRPSQISFEEKGLRTLIRQYTREAGVRNLRREIATVIRKATRKFAEGRKSRIIINPKFLQESLGVPRYLHNVVEERPLISGMAIGLAWTPVGGDILFIEANQMPGSKGMSITGQLGDVMKESINAAMSYVRAHWKELGLEEKFYEQHDFHIHVPAGAVPKDGPSAGITMLTALISLLTQKPIRPYLAMSGEITLKGQVLPVGGIKEKIIAAYRAGIKMVILPKENEKDYKEEVPEDIQKELKAHFVNQAQEVLKIAFL